MRRSKTALGHHLPRARAFSQGGIVGKKNRKSQRRSHSWLDFDLINSKAFLGLSGKAAVIVLIWFHQKANKRRVKSGKRKGQLVITNNGEITFSYADALKLGVSRKTFHRVLRELVEKRGFVDVVERGNWYLKESTKFAISERWKKFGTPEYQEKKLKRSLPKGVGFQPDDEDDQTITRDSRDEPL
jgi:hypothetical protein